MKSPELNNPVCAVCGGNTRRSKNPDGLICLDCGLFSAVATETSSLIEPTPAPPSENNELVYLHSKKKIFARALKKINALSRPGGKLLDVGCGFGYFMKAASADGWDCDGVEISPVAVEHCRKILGLKVYERPLAELNLPADSFDVATMWGVLDIVPS
ncbi:MAG: class I SAM-dependent methyltransferase, partial [Endomicrobiia bacterium]|nr:class I SAM-dependent methyltransferase [Endomicrobiia bacterium]